ncbi:TauD/TfdA family dioxygenase [Nocardiopsis alba]|uniref:Taurine catabolism dioxygenase TauD, TfdA family protein n=1 Tax=Nocardiopsis alba (strain ATCC BAA-2165 / BE74) TaxID=1205910 RepID=J7L731_NOCAA|nr:TauD/TfdA family dioxygenase [Nocardiopsis alba]AFR09453.1 taurine catabolism dioxygenase TauD, TfdA family protein [Nocardiopsis alba ATCC BAA-2165]
MTFATEKVTLRREAGKPSIIEIPGVRNMDEAVRRLEEEGEAISKELTESGSVLVRGLPVEDAEAFARVRDVLLPRPAAYKEKATPRTDFGGGVFSSTDLPAIQPIRLHNENSYTLDFPGALLFCCVVAPEKGGATTVGDMREALALIPEDLRRRFEEHGWLLVRNYSALAGLPWQTSFATESPAEVEAYCAENIIGCEWLDKETLRTRQRRSAIITHPRTGERVWFNHAAFWSRWSLEEDVRDVLLDTYGEDGLPFETFVGDGTPLTEEEAGALNEAYARVTRRETYRKGDLLLVDNILNAHGREAFEGDRKILVAMGNPVPLDECAPTAAPSTTVSRNGDAE